MAGGDLVVEPRQSPGLRFPEPSGISISNLFVANVACASATRHPISCAFMLTISGLGKSYGGRTLFADASLQVNREDRIGLVGPNGAGKTTLFSLILQLEAPDAGTIALQRGTTLGYL